MRRVVTSTAEGATLDWLVAKALGHWTKFGTDGILATPEGTDCWQWWYPHRSWEQGGPIIDSHDFTIRKRSAEEEKHLAYPNPNFKCKAELWVDRKYYCAHGPTVLMAALRCFVMTKFGDTSEVPDELT